MSDLDDDYSSEGDDDYMPSGEASEGDSEGGDGPESGDEEVTGNVTVVKKKKQLKKKAQEVKRKRKGGIQLDGGEEEDAKDDDDEDEPLIDANSKEELEKKKEEKEKKRADDLWSSFMKDVGPPKKAKTSAPASSASKPSSSVTSKASGTSLKSTDKSSTSQQSKKKEMVTVTKIFDFAGEKVKVEEKVAADSKDAKIYMKKEDEKPSASSSIINKTSAGPSVGTKRPGGLSSVLGQLGKKSKLSVLEKSKLDWNRFKSKEGIEEEVSAFVKGKSGFVEKQNFLARADERQYEKERELRMAQSKILR